MSIRQLMLIVLVANASSAQLAMSQSVPPPHTLAGFVRDSLGHPIGDATVNLDLRPALRSIQTDDRGHFAFDGVTVGHHQIAVLRSGYIPVRQGLNQPGADIEITITMHASGGNIHRWFDEPFFNFVDRKVGTDQSNWFAVAGGSLGWPTVASGDLGIAHVLRREFNSHDRVSQFWGGGFAMEHDLVLLVEPGIAGQRVSVGLEEVGVGARGAIHGTLLRTSDPWHLKANSTYIGLEVIGPFQIPWLRTGLDVATGGGGHRLLVPIDIGFGW